MTAKINYEGGLRTICLHEASKNHIRTDAPKDNHGLGEAFSPTDLTATSLGACMLTVMGIKAMSWGKDITGAKCSIEKHMIAEPRRISRIEVDITIPAGNFSLKEQDILRHTGFTCPVAKSLHPEIDQQISISFI